METTVLEFNVNGKSIRAENVDPEATLASYLRNQLGLTGTKLACEEGVCGVCTVVIGEWNHKLDKARYKAVNACLLPLYMAHQRFVLTVEGIGSTKKIHPIQDRLARGHGTQCGFCSPGFVMSAYALLRNNPRPSFYEINQAVKGNLCRCTGYRPILEALYSFSENSCCNGLSSSSCPCLENSTSPGREKLVTFDDFPKFDETQEILFPPSLIIDKSPKHVLLEGRRVKLVVPVSWQELDAVAKLGDELTVVSSGMKTRLAYSQSLRTNATWVSIHNLPSMSTLEVNDEEVSLGSALSIADMVLSIDIYCVESISRPIRKLFDKFSSLQVMNVASWSGALLTGSSDTYSVFLALNPKLLIRDVGGTFATHRLEDLLDAHGNVKLSRGSVIVMASFSRSQAGLRVFTFKQGLRPGADSTVLNCVGALWTSTDVIERARLAISFGSKAILCGKLAECLRDKRCDGLSKHTSELLSALQEDIAQFSSIADFNYKRKLARAAIVEMVEQLEGNSPAVQEDEQPIESTQLFTEWSREGSDACGRPLATQSSDRYATGEAVYVNDMKIKDVVHAGFVLSSKAHAKILGIDTEEALHLDGVLGYVDVKDIPESGTNYPGKLPFNILGPDDCPVFAEEEVEAVGQVIGLVVAKDVGTVRRAAKLVKVRYEELPAILTMEEAIEKKSYLFDPQHFGVDQDTVEEALSKCDIVLEGTTRTGAQEHCYMETQSSIAIPGENDEWIIYASTQAINLLQLHTAAALGLPAHKVTVRAKRIGGAFGGKCQQSLPPGVWSAVAAAALHRPVSVVLSRNEDMLITGKRHPAMVKYRVGLDSNGTLRCAYLKVYLDGGYAIDLSHMVTFLSAAVSNTCYRIPVMRAEGFTLKTNKSSNTAFRGFGAPQAFFAMNCILTHAAHTLKKPLEQIMEMNFNKSGDTELLGYPILNDALLDCWKECLALSEFIKRRDEVDHFNKSSKSIKRGIAMGATRMGLTHSGAYEQASALVQIFLDGSVTISIGGIEMGQGLNTKCLQVASRALGIPFSMITIIDASTDKTCNAPETGGSQGADIHGRAIQACCERLMCGLRPILEEEPDWPRAVMKAYHMQLPLQASEHVRIDRAPHGILPESPTYHTSGAACVMSEINCRTGEQKLLSADFVLDVGRSLNPAVDIGQIEGAFMQSYGNFTCEEITYDESGKLVQDSFGKYKIPTSSMTPRRFRVKLLKESDCFPEQVYSSKGIGEPPMMLGVAAFASLRYAISARLQDLGFTDFMEITAPLTASKILSYCNPE